MNVIKLNTVLGWDMQHTYVINKLVPIQVRILKEIAHLEDLGIDGTIQDMDLIILAHEGMHIL